MFWKTFRLPFSLMGIPIQIDLSLLVVLPLLAWLIGRNVPELMQMIDPGASTASLTQGAMPYLLGLMAAVGLFVSVVVHELSHAMMALRYGVRTRSITLWFLGGVAGFDEMPRQRWAEAIVAVVGPLTSFGVAVVCGVVEWLMPAGWVAARFVFGYLAALNVILAVFNLIPALPMDGGRVLRSALATRMPYIQATQIAGSISKVIAVGLGILGFLSVNIFLMLIAFFIYMAVSGEQQQSVITEVLKDVPISELMTTQVKTVTPDLAVAELPQKMLHEGHLSFPVVDGGQVAGMVTLADLRSAPAEAHVGDIMSRQVPKISINATALDAFRRMAQEQFGRLIVTDPQDQMAGILTRSDILRALQVKTIGLDTHEPHHEAPPPLPAYSRSGGSL